MGFNATSRSLFPREIGTMSIVHKAGWGQFRSGWVRKISAPLGFDLKIVQPVASSYTDCALPAQAGRFTRNLNKVSMAYRERNLARNSNSHFRNKSADGTSQSRSVHLKMLIVVRVVTNFTAFYETRTFITVSKKSHH